MVRCIHKKGSQNWLPFFVGLAFNVVVGVIIGLGTVSSSTIAAEAHLYDHDSQGRILVAARMDGFGPFPFLLDTGAGRSILYSDLVYTLGLKPVPFATREIFTATGRKASALYPIGSLTALGIRRRMGRVPAYKKPNNFVADGVIGVDFLRGTVLYVSVATNETGSHGVQLLPDADPFTQAEWSVFHGRPVGRGSLALDVSINGVLMPALFDTGAVQSVINGPAMEAVFATGLRVSGKHADIVAGGGRVKGDILKLPEGVKINDVAQPLKSVVVADLPIFTLLGAKRVPAMILGMDIVTGQDFAVDFKDWRLFVRTNPDIMPAAHVEIESGK